MAYDVDVVDCRKDEEGKPSWGILNNELSRPVDPNESWRNYLPTQFIAEHLKTEGYGGLIYRSAMNEDGYNIVLFYIDSTRLGNRGLFSVSSVKYEYERHELFGGDV